MLALARWMMRVTTQAQSCPSLVCPKPDPPRIHGPAPRHLLLDPLPPAYAPLASRLRAEPGIPNSLSKPNGLRNLLGSAFGPDGFGPDGHETTYSAQWLAAGLGMPALLALTLWLRRTR